jgi:glycosyltransferase involved in cell wall biosynthesis
MKIAVVKPDYKIHGGFEVVIDKIIGGLKQYGYSLDLINVDMTKPRYHLEGLDIPPEVYHAHEEFFRYTTSIEAYSQLDLQEYDMVLTTQPPSFAVNHPKVVLLFYHHLKIYYDLYDVYRKVTQDSAVDHELTKDLIREIDSYFLTDEKYYIAGSNHIANRLRTYNGLSKHLYTFAAGIDDDYYSYAGPVSFEDPICIGRHEFPKRPELFIHAMKHVHGIKGKVIGEGGKTNDLKRVDSYLSNLHHKSEDISDELLWKSVMFDLSKIDDSKKHHSEVVFTGRLSHKELIEAYASALCVVCPAYEEDYGLTAIEAMAFRKPVIVCKDGGGLAEFVEDGMNGFVVEPTGEAIAEAIQRLKDDSAMLKRMSDNAYEFSRKYSWENAIKSLSQIFEQICSGSQKEDDL